MNWKVKSGVTAALLMMGSCLSATPAFADVHIQVHHGDTLWGLAKHYGITVQALEAANPSLHPRDLRVGVTLVVPAKGTSHGTPVVRDNAASVHPVVSPNQRVSRTRMLTYTVRTGDVMWTIAQHFGISITALKMANPEVNPVDMRVGTLLHIPTTGGDGAKSQQFTRGNPAVVASVTYRKTVLPPLSFATRATTVLATARSLMGIHYTWGGNNPASGFDCSGFTQYVFAKNGVELPRTATLQAGMGTLVPRDQLQPGDLLFFTDTYANHYANQVTHVGIYIGDGNMIESSSVHNQGVMVVKDVFANPYYQDRYYAAKNVLS